MPLLRRLFPMNPVTYFMGLTAWMITGCFLAALCIKAGLYLRGFLRSFRSPLTSWNQVWRSRCIGKIRSEESRHLRSITSVNRVHLTGIKLDGRVPQWRKPGDTTCWLTPATLGPVGIEVTSGVT